MPTTHEIITENVTHQIVDEIFQHVISEEIITHIIEAEQGPVGPQGNPGDGNAVNSETPTGPINSSNVMFTLTYAPITNSLKLYLLGQRLKILVDYNLSGNVITFISAPIPGDILLADYNY